MLLVFVVYSGLNVCGPLNLPCVKCSFILVGFPALTAEFEDS
jgi:hypothetical protein